MTELGLDRLPTPVRNGLALALAAGTLAGGVMAAKFTARASASGNVLKNIPTLVPNDPGYDGAGATGLKQIGAERLWALKAPGQVGCASIDTGVNPNQDLDIESNYNGRDGSASAPDSNGHGTKVASIMAGKYNNNWGVAGIAGGICKIENIKDSGSLEDEIRHAANDPNVEVINISLDYAQGQPPVKSVNDEIQYALDKGKVVVIGAGNLGANLDNDPNANALASSAPPDAIVVGGAKPSCAPIAASNYGSRVDVIAPYTVYAVDNNANLSQFSGTSASAPIIAGLAAWIKAQNPDMPPKEVKSIIDSTEQQDKCVDLYAAAMKAHIPPATETNPTTTTTTLPNKLKVNLQVVDKVDAKHHKASGVLKVTPGNRMISSVGVAEASSITLTAVPNKKLPKVNGRAIGTHVDHWAGVCAYVNKLKNHNICNPRVSGKATIYFAVNGNK